MICLLAFARYSSGAGLALTEGDAKTPNGDPWPLDTCAVSGEKLDSMDDAVVYDHEGRDVRFCCKACPAPATILMSDIPSVETK